MKKSFTCYSDDSHLSSFLSKFWAAFIKEKKMTLGSKVYEDQGSYYDAKFLYFSLNLNMHINQLCLVSKCS